MQQSLYVATTESRSGKSLVCLGVMDLISRRVEGVCLFRPVIRQSDGRLDNDIELIRQRYRISAPYEAMYGVTDRQARQMLGHGKRDQLFKQIFSKFKELQTQYDFVLCEGTDRSVQTHGWDTEFDAALAENFGAPLLLLVNGATDTAEHVLSKTHVAREQYLGHGSTLAATFINRVDRDHVDPVRHAISDLTQQTEPMFVLPDSSTLNRPTLHQISEHLNAQVLYAPPESLDREAMRVSVAAMQFPHLLRRLVGGDLIITPGDRHDIILGTIASAMSSTAPTISGLVLTCGIRPEPAVQELIDGLSDPTFPILLTEHDTYQTVTQINNLPAYIAPGNERKIATALGHFEKHVDVEVLRDRLAVARSERVTPLMFEHELIERAKQQRKHIVLPEGDDERILRAADILVRRKMVDLTVLGQVEDVRHRLDNLGLDPQALNIVDPLTSPWRDTFIDRFYQLRQHKGVTRDNAADFLQDVTYFATMMVETGQADGMVSGATHTTAQTVRPALQVIRTSPGTQVVSSVFFMCLPDRVLVYGDCAINPNPDPEQLASIAISSAETARQFGVDPRVAMLSYSTGESGSGEDVDKVRQAVELVRQRSPQLMLEGPIQYDAAIDPTVARSKMPGSEVAGRATVFIFPDLNTGNNTYKAVQRSAGAVAVGPVLQGLRKPVNDLSRGCLLADIINTVAITAIQAQEPSAVNADPQSEAVV